MSTYSSTLKSKVKFRRFTPEEEQRWAEYCRIGKLTMRPGTYTILPPEDEMDMRTVAQDENGHHWMKKVVQKLSMHGFTFLLKDEDHPDAIVQLSQHRKRAKAA